MSAAVFVLPSLSPMACYGVSFTVILEGRSSHNEVYTSTNTTNTGERTKPMSMSRMEHKHKILVLGCEKISRCFVSFIAPRYNGFKEAYSTTFQFTFCRYLILG